LKHGAKFEETDEGRMGNENLKISFFTVNIEGVFLEALYRRCHGKQHLQYHRTYSINQSVWDYFLFTCSPNAGRNRFASIVIHQ
jgi:hypothetical protein